MRTDRTSVRVRVVVRAIAAARSLLVTAPPQSLIIPFDSFDFVPSLLLAQAFRLDLFDPFSLLRLLNFAQAHPPIARFKVVLVGDGGVGKTTFVNRLKGILDPNAPYNTTHAFEIHPIRLFFSNGTTIDFDIFDTSGVERIEGLLEMQYYEGGHACIGFYDLLSRLSLDNSGRWLRAVRRVRPDIPCVLLGNKDDMGSNIKSSMRPDKVENKIRHWNVQHYRISVRDDPIEQVFQPLQYLARQLMQDETLQVVGAAAAGPMGAADLETAEQQRLDDLKEATHQILRGGV